MEIDVNNHFTYYRFIESVLVLRHSLCNTVDEQMGSTRNVSYNKWHIITVTNSAVTPLSDNTDAIQGQTCCDAGDRSVCITTWHSTKTMFSRYLVVLYSGKTNPQRQTEIFNIGVRHVSCSTFRQTWLSLWIYWSLSNAYLPFVRCLLLYKNNVLHLGLLLLFL